MSKTVDDLVKVYIIAHFGADNGPRNRGRYRAGIAAVIRALRDEMTGVSRLRDVQRLFEEILGSDAGEKVAGMAPMGDESRIRYPAPATDPAPAPCLWRIHHQTRNGPLYVSQCDGEWRHATSDPKCPSCGKEVFFPATDPAPAVCEWTKGQRGGVTPSCSDLYEYAPYVVREGVCPECKAPIKFTEAK